MWVSLALIFLVVPAFGETGSVFDWIQKVGSGRDSYVGLATDLTSNSYVVGNTRSADFPVKSPLQATLASADAADIFVIKLDPSGNVVYSTCFGGSGEGMASAVAIDPRDNLDVTGLTNSSDFPVTKRAFHSKIAWSSLSRASYSRPYFRCRRANPPEVGEWRALWDGEAGATSTRHTGPYYCPTTGDIRFPLVV